MEQIYEDEIATLLFGNFIDRLAFFTLPSAGINIAFPLEEPFKNVLKTISRAWKEHGFKVLFLQDPRTVYDLIGKFHEYNWLPLPSKVERKHKSSLSVKFTRYLRNRLENHFPGLTIQTVKANIDMFIRDADTGELLPPTGLIELPDRSNFEVDEIEPSDMDNDEFFIKDKFPVSPIKCECCDESIPCPNCTKIDLLRGWGENDRTVALCYYCGTLFYADNGHIIDQLKGDRASWGAMALSIIGMHILEQDG
ncbi:MAG: hypothetical protein ACFFCS_28095 [Candidatus Hodarchaeota archaeon]